MSNISVVDILKIHGKWIQASKFESFVSEKMKISERYAHNLIKKACKEKQILRVELPNRAVIYGLAEFGPIEQAVVEGSSARSMLSRQLIPALREIAGIIAPRYSVSGGAEEYVSPEDMKLLVKVAEDYLKADPELQRPFEDFREKNEEVAQAKKSFIDSLMDKLTQKFGKELVVEPIKESKYQSFVGRNIPSLICSHMLYGAPTDLKPDGEKIWYGDSLVAKGRHFLESIEEFIKHESEDKSNIETIEQIEKKEDEAHKAQLKFQPEIRKLIIRIKQKKNLKTKSNY